MRLLLVAALCAGRLAHAELPDFLPPESKVLIGLSVRGLVNSPLLASLGDAKAAASHLTSTGPLAGLNLLKDIDDVIIATSGEGDNPPALLVVRGRFSPTLMPATAKPYHGVPVLEDAKSANGTFALLDAATIIGGDLKMVHAAIDRRGKDSAIAPVLAERVRTLESRYDVWGVGEVPKGIHSSQAPSPELEAIDRFEFGASLRSGLEVAAQIHVRSAKDAEKLMQSMKLIEMMLSAQAKPGNGTKIDIQSDQENIKLSLLISEEDLKKGIEAQKAKFAANAGASAAPAPVKPVVKPVAPTPGSITTDDRGNTVTVTLPRKN
ncbi:MAG TPA: hypothetical protein VMS37_04045 [Verrucomicrobiae bacterium]|nr:hypothetical protein [Verrucomicrobiae bacterium]